jgi:magnesium-transporting ATPase (P-type)
MIDEENLPDVEHLFIACGTWILITANMIPVSILITLEMCKFFQAMFMEYDIMMFDQE